MKKLLRLTVLLVALMFSGAGLFAQRECASHEIYQQMAASDPQFAINQQKLEAFTQQFIANGGAAAVPVTHAGTIVYRIPVVFHVLFNSSQPATNISDERLRAQLKVLNEDFQKLNSDWLKTPTVYRGRVADVQIEFCLPEKDPAGNPTTGIIRKQTSVSSFSSNNAMKYDAQGGSNAWPRDSYLNFWVCNLGSSLLGYAQFPGGAAATDGVVCHYGSVGSTEVPGEFGAGSYGIGRTATHEIGHWLNLRHIWGDARCGNDGVGDTPVHPSSNGGCPSATLTTNCNPNKGDLMMWMNYMDYTYDRCMYMFTEGQKDRMWTVFQPGGARFALTQLTAGCQGDPGGSGCTVPGSLSSSGTTETGVSLSWGAVSGAQSYTVQYRTPVGSGVTWTQTNAATNTISLTGLTAASTYEWQVRTNCSGSSSAFSSSAQFTTQQPAITCSPASGLSVANVTLSGATLNWTNGAEAISTRLEYKTNSASTWTVVNPATSPYSLGGLAASTLYNWRVQSNCNGATSTYANGANFTTLADPNACTDAYEPNDNSGAAKSIAAGSSILAKICTATDVDWFTFSNNNQNRAVRVTLNVPAGVSYDFRLYRPNGQLAGTTSGSGSIKSLSYSGNPTGAYRIEVFSSSGFGATAYSLLAEIGSGFREDAGRMIVLDKAVNMFPNPASHELMLQFGNEWRGKADVIMTDIQGRHVQRNVVNAVGTVSVNVAALQMGLYLVQVTNGELTQTQKVMIKR